MKKNVGYLVISTIFAVLSLLMVIGGLVLLVMTVVKFDGESINYTTLVTGIILFVVGFIVGKIVINSSHGRCSKCGNKMKGADFEYQEVKRKPKNAKSATDNRIVYTVKIAANCPHCGKHNSFNKDFTLQVGENPQYAVDEFCERKFGE